MKLTAPKKYLFILVGVITAVMLCMLPFLAVTNNVIHIYTRFRLPNPQELGLARELRNLGYVIKLNSEALPKKGTLALWFKNPDAVTQITQSDADYNFIYNDDYYPFDWYGQKNLPIVLTPYQELYEHYTRSNVKTARFTLGVDQTDFYAEAKERIYPLVYFGDNNKISPLADFLKGSDQVFFLGHFWDNTVRCLPLKDGSLREIGNYLTQTQIVAVYSAPDTPQARLITPELMEATLSGALVMSNPLPAVKEVFGDSLVYYQNTQDFTELVNYYITHPQVRTQKALKAQKIALHHFTTAASAKRLNDLIHYLQQD